MKEPIPGSKQCLDTSVIAGNWDLFKKPDGHAQDTVDARIAVIGDKDIVCAFAAIGFEVFPYTRDYKVRETIKDLAGKNYSLILITESCMENLGGFLEPYTSQPYPIILPIPDGVFSKKIGHKRIDANLKKVNAAKGGNQ